MIGTLGKKIVFEVSDDTVMTFQNMSREVSGRWANHEALGVKPKPEFLAIRNKYKAVLKNWLDSN